MLTAAALLLVVFLVRLHNAGHPPALLANCHRSQLRLSTSRIAAGAVVSWSATGPQTRVMLWIDVKALTRAGGGYLPIASGAATPAVASTARLMAVCHLTGSFTAPQARGVHTVDLFELSGASPPRVATARLTVGG